MHTTDNVLFLLDGRSIYYRVTHTHIHIYAEAGRYNGSACVHRMLGVLSYQLLSRFCVENIVGAK